MKIKLLATSVVAACVSTMASAQAFCNANGICTGVKGNAPAVVPEISAVSGAAAIAMVLAVVALTWERNRRA